MGEQRGYYVDRDHTATSVHAPNAFVAWANAASSPADLSARLASEGFSKVLVVPRELRRLGTADDVAASVLYLLDADFVTGSVLVADGGLLLGP